MARRTADFGHFAAQRVLQLGDGGVARFQQLVGLNGKLRNLRANRSVAGCAASRGRRAEHKHRAKPRRRPQNRAVRPAGPADSAAPPRHRSQAAPAALRQRESAWDPGSRSAGRATASTKDGATEEENCLRGRKRHKPVSSIQVRASSSVRVPCPFWRILSARDASNCSAVKEKPHFQARAGAWTTLSPERRAAALTNSKSILDSMEGPLDLLPGIQQSYWTSVRATGWVLSLCKFQQ